MSFYGLDDHFDFGSITVKNDVSARDNAGRFAELIREKNRRATESAGEAGAHVARSTAPTKTGELAASIRWSLVPGTSTGKTGDWEQAEIRVGTNHWRYVAQGAPPHLITGRVHFFWVREGRYWTPGPNMIHHPGTKSVPFMEMAYEAAKHELVEAMRREYRT